MAQRTIPAQAFPVGTTTSQFAVTGTIHTASAVCDASSWTDPSTTVHISIGQSRDGGVTFTPLVSVGNTVPPPWQDDHGPTSSFAPSTTFGPGLTPTNIQVAVTVTGNPVTLGPTIVTTT